MKKSLKLDDLKVTSFALNTPTASQLKAGAMPGTAEDDSCGGSCYNLCDNNDCG